MAVNRDTLRLAAELRASINGVVDAHMQALAIRLANAWDEVAADTFAALDDLAKAAEGGRVPRHVVERSTRLTAALDAITERLEAALGETETAVVGSLRAVVDDAIAGQHAVAYSQLPAGTAAERIVWAQVNSEALEWIIVRTTQQIHAAHLPLSGEAVAVMKREIVRGLAAGANPRTTAARIMGRVRGEFFGGYARAERIARTETLDAMRAAQRAHDLANRDVIAEWEWVASLSARTCPACWAMDGTRHPLEEDGPIDHQNGRCARVPITKSWADLGLDIDEPPPITRDAEATFDGLDPEQQRAILGPGRYEAWQEGRYPMSSWATRRTTDGWRDSMIPSPVPAP